MDNLKPLDGRPEGWAYRAVFETRGTELGAFLLAVLRLGIDKVPRFSDSGFVLPNGQIRTIFTDRKGHSFQHDDISADDLRRQLTGMAEKLKFTDAEVDDMYARVRTWITADLRPNGTDLAAWYRGQLYKQKVANDA
jgi:hypothetical protein